MTAIRFALLLLCFILPIMGFEIPKDSRQCIVGLTDDWSSSRATLYRFQKDRRGWHLVGKTIPARVGKSGLAWGFGIHPLPLDQTRKKEGDWKAPAGIFELGGVWGYAKEIRRHPSLPYRRVTPRDLWVEDSSHKLYNRHMILDHEPNTPWEKKQQMRQSDPAHSLKLFIKHNAAPHTTAGMGSSIFFHIWRADGAKPSAGCTTMSESELKGLIAWVDPSQKPLYILLPRDQYQEAQRDWKLPPID